MRRTYPGRCLARNRRRGLTLLEVLLVSALLAGFAVLLLPLYWLGIMFHVYGIEDRVGPAAADEGEQY